MKKTSAYYVYDWLYFGFLLTTLLASCTNKASELNEKQERPFPVVVAEVTQRDVPVYLEAIGNIVAFNQVDVRPQVNGKVVAVYVSGGQDVTVGQPLYQIDPIPYQIALDRAKATLTKDEAQLEYARSKLERYQKLVNTNFVSKLNIEEYKSNVDTQEGQVMIDRAEANLAKVNLNYTTVTAPIEGQISLNVVDIGNLVIANDTNALTRILQIDPIAVYFTLAQQDFQQLQRVLAQGKRQFKAILPFDQKEFDGELMAIDNQVNMQTGTIQLKGVIPNKEKILWPGEFVRVRLFIRTKEHVSVVPSSAVQVGQKGSYVYVLKEDMTVQANVVKTGEEIDGMTVIDEGLEAGMKVVVDGQINLRPGVKVIVSGLKNQAEHIVN